MFNFLSHPDIYELRIKYVLKSNNPKKKVHEYVVGYSTQVNEVDKFMALPNDKLERLIRQSMSEEQASKSKFELISPVTKIFLQVCVKDLF